MKSEICNSIIFVFLLFSLSISAQNKEMRETGDFSKLTATGNIRVELYPSEKSYLKLEVIGTDPDNLISENSDHEYHIRLKTSTPKDAKVLVKCYFISLEKITSQNQALITGDEIIELKELEMDAKGGGKIELQLALEHLKAEAKQGGVIVLKGEVERQEVEVGSGGTYSAYQLEAKDSYIKSNTGGVAKVIARRIMDANANTKGYIAFVGNPVSKITNTSLGGEIDHFQEIPR